MEHYKYWTEAEEMRDLASALRTTDGALLRAEEVYHWAQAVLTALNVGDVKKESPLHKKLREVLINYRAAMERENL